mgnify:CR=1 FL=1
MQTITDAHLQNLTQQVAHTLQTNKGLLVTAESCTGGWLGKLCTDLSGSSHWYDRGFITYSNQAKQDLLDVAAATLQTFGAVSKQTAIEMAEGALTHSQSNIAVSITGIAGPDGGSDEKPVGTVYIAWAMPNRSSCYCHYHFNGDRQAIRRQAMEKALEGIIKNARDSKATMG